ncbi:hypothetical protein CQJ94_16695 [Glycomyces fuscus]|nr:hypothetical protein CQJ94_16695 [Glycomyces fuscus]
MAVAVPPPHQDLSPFVRACMMALNSEIHRQIRCRLQGADRFWTNVAWVPWSRWFPTLDDHDDSVLRWLRLLGFERSLRTRCLRCSMDLEEPVFVIPAFIESRNDIEIFEETLKSLVAQSDAHWKAVIVDDHSTYPWDERDLDGFDPRRMRVVQKSSNVGPGECRNVGVAWAAETRAPFILFQDADDIAHPDRVRSARRLFEEEPGTDFLYSTFDIIDEHGESVPRDKISGSVLEVLDSHSSPIEGRDAWIPVATRTGYTTLTSTVTVRTDLAVRYPFPACHASEDTHAWLRMMADGGELRFVKDIRAGYRIRGGEQGSASRERQGEGFYWSMLQVDLDGFVKAMHSALSQGRIEPERCPGLIRDYHLKQAETMESEGLASAASLCRSLAMVSVGASHSPSGGGGEQR